MVFHERHRTRILTSDFAYYHPWRTPLAMDYPAPRPVLSANRGRGIAVPEGGGLHHHDERRAASSGMLRTP